jgi:hypothetical protein
MDRGPLLPVRLGPHGNEGDAQPGISATADEAAGGKSIGRQEATEGVFIPWKSRPTRGDTDRTHRQLPPLTLQHDGRAVWPYQGFGKPEVIQKF